MAVEMAGWAELASKAKGAWDSDVAWSYRHSPVAIVSSVVLAICVLAALFAPWLAPKHPYDLASLIPKDALAPPAATVVRRPAESHR